jgi:glycine dehydrogenase
MPLDRAAFLLAPGLLGSHCVLRQDRIRQFHVRGLQARIVGADFLHGGFQVRPANAAIAGDEAAGVVLRGNDQLVILEGQVGRTGGGTGRNDVTPKLSAIAEPTGRDSKARVATASLRRMIE